MAVISASRRGGAGSGLGSRREAPRVSAVRTILVPHDFSGPAARALEAAAELAQRLGARVHLLHVYGDPAAQLAPETFRVESRLPELRRNSG